MFRIGSFTIENRTILAPMAGVTDLPFRRLCRSFGAGLAVSEMVTSDARLWDSRKSRSRLPHREETAPRMVQIAGGDPAMVADAARRNADLGAQIIDINMGCPAKKVCRKAAGSALLKDERLVADILRAAVAAVDVPVTLKIRTGWSPELRNGVTIARLAEDLGISALAVHGRTRACKFEGQAEYDTIAAIVEAVSIPVFANGDIASPRQAKAVLEHTGAAAVMIGRAAQGRPWLFREINHYLATGRELSPPTSAEVRHTLLDHLSNLHAFYRAMTGDEILGPRIARKHVGWYLETLQPTATPGADQFRRFFNSLDEADAQVQALHRFFDKNERHQDRAA
ncbi:MAG: tRNA dihydrouridine synthase DusB [Porticoccaceae bacterium]|nr:tRNA dihydrouridine synthase DusB [Porticoccaceae bacterium]